MPENGQSRTTNDPRVLIFAMELVFTNGNASEAARNIGEAGSWGRSIIKKFPELREFAQKAVGRWADGKLSEWADMHAEARETIRENLKCDDERTRQRAAEYIVERVEGKVPDRVVDETPKVNLNTVYWRFVGSVVVYKGWSLAQATAYADEHPEELEKWGKSRGLLPDAQEITAEA